MKLCRLFAMIVACALLFAPTAALARVAGPSHDVSGHCADRSAGHDKAAPKTCCVATAAALPDHVLTAPPPIAHRLPIARPAPSIGVGHLVELATPPPRRA